jgi:hypothetical protein
VVQTEAAETTDLNALPLGQGGAQGVENELDRESNVLGGEL